MSFRKNRGLSAVLSVLFLSMCVLSAVGCSKKSEIKQITVTYVKSPLNVPSMVEKKKGIFEKHMRKSGIEVNYAEITSGSEQIQALESGDVQFLYAVGATSVIIGKANGADVKVLNMYGSAPKAYRIITGDKSIHSASGLKGKRVGGPKGTTLHELLAAYLKEEGMEITDVEYLPLSIPDAFAALESGQIDAALLAGPVAYQAEQNGYERLTDGEGLTEGSTMVVTSNQFAKAHPDIVKTFQDAEKEVMAEIRQDEEGALRIAAEFTGISQKAVEEMYPLYDFHMEITEKDKEAVTKTSLFLQDIGMIEKIPDIW